MTNEKTPHETAIARMSLANPSFVTLICRLDLRITDGEGNVTDKDFFNEYNFTLNQLKNKLKMGQILKVNLNVGAIPKEKVFVGKKGKYIDLTIFVNDKPDQFGNNVTAQLNQTKEEREGNADKIFLGSGKVMFDGKGPKGGKAKDAAAPAQPTATEAPPDDLPW